jgi:uncharacterized protein YdaU (DUF1376 family)
MRNPWMPFYVNDFQVDTMELQADELGVYVTMLCLAWRRGGALPGDEKDLKSMLKRSIANFHGHNFNKVVPKLLGAYFYRDEDGNFRNKRIEKELQTFGKRSANAKQSADKRWSVSKEIKDIGNASAMLSQSHTQSIASVYKKTKPTVCQKNGCRLPADWKPKEHTELVLELENFRDYWLAQPGQKAVKVDWDATWRVWVRRSGQTYRKPDKPRFNWADEYARRASETESQSNIIPLIGGK